MRGLLLLFGLVAVVSWVLIEGCDKDRQDVKKREMSGGSRADFWKEDEGLR